MGTPSSAALPVNSSVPVQAAANTNEEAYPGYRNPENFIVVSEAYPTVTAQAAGATSCKRTSPASDSMAACRVRRGVPPSPQSVPAQKATYDSRTFRR